MLRGGILVAVLLAALAAAPAAQARRAATPAERQAMAAAAGIPAQCAVAIVSTIDERFGAVRANDAVGCAESSGFSAVRRAGAAWEELGVTSKEITARCPDEVPARAGRDLLLCRRPVASIACLPASPPPGAKRALRVQPARCATRSLALRSLRWRGWGAVNAYARGSQNGAGAVRVKAYERRACPSGDRVYTRLRTRTGRGVKTTRLPLLCPA